jgi:hypothetical protein
MTWGGNETFFLFNDQYMVTFKIILNFAKTLVKLKKKLKNKLNYNFPCGSTWQSKSFQNEK